MVRMNPQILMIEDDASIRDMTKMNLNMNGFQQVYCASDGEEGLAMAAQLAPDLILLDVMLPGIDGLTVCRNLKNNPALADIPVTHSVSLDGRPLTLTADEFKTLALLAANPGRVFTRNQIIREVKGDNYPVTARAIDMHMVNLRRKLGEWADHIETVRGVGYRAAGE